MANARIDVRIWSDPEFTSLTDSQQVFALACMMFGVSGPCSNARLARRTGWRVEFIRIQREALQETTFAHLLVGQKKRRKLPNAVRVAVFTRDSFACVKCGSRSNLEVDHIHPVAKGGSDDLENLQTLCAPCNRRKGAKIGERVRAATA